MNAWQCLLMWPSLHVWFVANLLNWRWMMVHTEQSCWKHPLTIPMNLKHHCLALIFWQTCWKHVPRQQHSEKFFWMGIIIRVAHNLDGFEPCHKTTHSGGWFTRRKCYTPKPMQNVNINRQTGTSWWRDVRRTRREFHCNSVLWARWPPSQTTRMLSWTCTTKCAEMKTIHWGEKYKHFSRLF